MESAPPSLISQVKKFNKTSPEISISVGKNGLGEHCKKEKYIPIV